MPSDQAFCNRPFAASGSRKRAAGDADDEEAEKRPKRSDGGRGSPRCGDQSSPPGTSNGVSCSLNKNPPVRPLVTSSSSDPGPSDPSDPAEVLVSGVEKGPSTSSPSSDPSETTGPLRTNGVENSLSSEQSGGRTDQTAEDSRSWSWSCSSSSRCSSSDTIGPLSPSSCRCCSGERDAPSSPPIPNDPDGPTILQGSGTENVASCSEASSCGPDLRAEVEEEIQVPECLWQHDSSSDPDLEESNAVRAECSCSDDDNNGGGEKAVCDSDVQKVVASSGSPILPTEGSLWKSFINPNDPSGLKLILQRISDPLGCLHNGGRGEAEAGCSCEGTVGIDSDEVIKLRKFFPRDSDRPTDLPRESELEDIASSDPCSCSWCCNSCSSSSNSSGGGSFVESCERPAAKVDDKKAGNQPEIPDDMGGPPVQKYPVLVLQGDPEEEEEEEEEDTASCSSCLSGFAQTTHEMDQRVALCPSDASSGSWTDEAPDGYSELVHSLKYS